ncbi:hypothetical protein [Nonomuraea harbinensis]|uniref:NERD domain-containing protein n=1 Tax=Nonomuraea harbinensis TaxID=1286938 RepID=A0ABW1CAR5_9ACTN|nr:hypothetical protein [Nonomuraea harbinensis]
MLSAAVGPAIAQHVRDQHPVTVDDRSYRLDYLITGARLRVVIEARRLRVPQLRQNDLVGLKYVVLRFSYGERGMRDVGRRGQDRAGVAAALAFTRRRALIVTPGRVIRGTFATASDAGVAGNVLYPLRGGPLPAGVRARVTEVLDSDNGT